MTTTPSAATPNDGKKLAVEIDGARYARIPLRTHVVTAADDIVEVVVRYTDGHLQPGDLLFVTEKIVAISQGRSYPMEDIQPRRLATFLARYVTKTSFGIGLGIPETMEMALRECGTPRILFAAGVSAVTKVFGRTGDFYRVAGPKARGIDGPTAHTIPPYNHQVVLVPENPRGVALQLQSALPVAVEVAVVDINDLGGNVLGSTVSAERERLLVRILKDNPLGQGHEGTPLGIIRAA